MPVDAFSTWRGTAPASALRWRDGKFLRPRTKRRLQHRAQQALLRPLDQQHRAGFVARHKGRAALQRPRSPSAPCTGRLFLDAALPRLASRSTRDSWRRPAAWACRSASPDPSAPARNPLPASPAPAPGKARAVRIFALGSGVFDREQARAITRSALASIAGFSSIEGDGGNGARCVAADAGQCAQASRRCREIARPSRRATTFAAACRLRARA